MSSRYAFAAVRSSTPLGFRALTRVYFLVFWCVCVCVCLCVGGGGGGGVVLEGCWGGGGLCFNSDRAKMGSPTLERTPFLRVEGSGFRVQGLGFRELSTALIGSCRSDMSSCNLGKTPRGSGFRV